MTSFYGNQGGGANGLGVDDRFPWQGPVGPSGSVQGIPNLGALSQQANTPNIFQEQLSNPSRGLADVDGIQNALQQFQSQPKTVMASDMDDTEFKFRNLAAKYAAQDNSKSQQSSTGEDNGVSYKTRDEDHATGPDAWASLGKFMKTAEKKQEEKTAGWIGGLGDLWNVGKSVRKGLGTGLGYLTGKPLTATSFTAGAGGDIIGEEAYDALGWGGSKAPVDPKAPVKPRGLNKLWRSDHSSLENLEGLWRRGFHGLAAGSVGSKRFIPSVRAHARQGRRNVLAALDPAEAAKLPQTPGSSEYVDALTELSKTKIKAMLAAEIPRLGFGVSNIVDSHARATENIAKGTEKAPDVMSNIDEFTRWSDLSKDDPKRQAGGLQKAIETVSAAAEAQGQAAENITKPITDRFDLAFPSLKPPEEGAAPAPAPVPGAPQDPSQVERALAAGESLAESAATLTGRQGSAGGGDGKPTGDGSTGDSNASTVKILTDSATSIGNFMNTANKLLPWIAGGTIGVGGLYALYKVFEGRRRDREEKERRALLHAMPLGYKAAAEKQAYGGADETGEWDRWLAGGLPWSDDIYESSSNPNNPEAIAKLTQTFADATKRQGGKVRFSDKRHDTSGMSVEDAVKAILASKDPLGSTLDDYDSKGLPSYYSMDYPTKEPKERSLLQKLMLRKSKSEVVDDWPEGHPLDIAYESAINPSELKEACDKTELTPYQYGFAVRVHEANLSPQQIRDGIEKVAEYMGEEYAEELREGTEKIALGTAVKPMLQGAWNAGKGYLQKKLPQWLGGGVAQQAAPKVTQQAAKQVAPSLSRRGFLGIEQAGGRQAAQQAAPQATQQVAKQVAPQVTQQAAPVSGAFRAGQQFRRGLDATKAAPGQVWDATKGYTMPPVRTALGMTTGAGMSDDDATMGEIARNALIGGVTGFHLPTLRKHLPSVANSATGVFYGSGAGHGLDQLNSWRDVDSNYGQQLGWLGLGAGASKNKILNPLFNRFVPQRAKNIASSRLMPWMVAGAEVPELAAFGRSAYDSATGGTGVPPTQDGVPPTQGGEPPSEPTTPMALPDSDLDVNTPGEVPEVAPEVAPVSAEAGEPSDTPSMTSGFMDILKGLGKDERVASFGSTIDPILDAIGGEGFSQKINPLMKILMMAGGGLGIGGLLGGGKKMGLGGLGMMAIPLIYQMMQGKKDEGADAGAGTADGTGTTLEKLTNAERARFKQIIDDSWSDGSISEDEIKAIQSDPGALGAALKHPDALKMLQSATDNTYVPDWKPKTRMDQPPFGVAMEKMKNLGLLERGEATNALMYPKGKEYSSWLTSTRKPEPGLESPRAILGQGLSEEHADGLISLAKKLKERNNPPR